MDIFHDRDSDTMQCATRRYQRERGFTRGAFVVVPDWESPLRQYDDDALAARYEREHARDLGYERKSLARAMGATQTHAHTE